MCLRIFPPACINKRMWRLYIILCGSGQVGITPVCLIHRGIFLCLEEGLAPYLYLFCHVCLPALPKEPKAARIRTTVGTYLPGRYSGTP
jgi:hypothetical protein